MSKKDKLFWIPWVAAMGAASIMMLIGALTPSAVKAQAQKDKAAQTAKAVVVDARTTAKKVLLDSKIAASKVEVNAEIAAVKVLTEANQAATKVVLDANKQASIAVDQPTSMAYIAVTPATLPVVTAKVNPADPWSVFETLVNAIQARIWLVAIVAFIILLVFVLRHGAGLLARLTMTTKKLGGMFLWFTTDRGGAVLVLTSGVGGAALLAAVEGKAITPQLLVGGLMAGVTAAGGWNVVKRIIWPKDMPATPATPAGPDAPPPLPPPPTPDPQHRMFPDSPTPSARPNPGPFRGGTP